LPSRHDDASLAEVITRIVLTLCLTAVAVGCGGEASGDVEAAPDASPAAEERTRVVAAFYPLAFAAERVGGERVEVANLTPAGADPHDAELSARDVERVHAADVVLYLGEGFQPALERILADAPTRGVGLLEGLELRHGAGHGHAHEDDEHGHEDDEHAHDDEAVDPHVWLDPLRYAAMVERIGTELAAENEAAGLVAELERLHAEYEEGLADCARREIVTSHAAFGYLAERYGLTQISLAGLSHEAEPSARQLEELIEEVREHEATTVFFETLASPRLAETVAREAGATTAVLNPLEGLTREEAASGADYFSVMRDNLDALRRALGCR
jgi:zinc transport system substrate-binding protein